MNLLEQALRRPRDYSKLTPRHQWAIDSRLGILDWKPTKEEGEEFSRRWKEKHTPAKKDQIHLADFYPDGNGWEHNRDLPSPFIGAP